MVFNAYSSLLLLQVIEIASINRCLNDIVAAHLHNAYGVMKHGGIVRLIIVCNCSVGDG